jgi:transcriptional regulator with XRE-family HTH domain
METVKMLNQMSNKAFRGAFVEENIKTGIAFQVRALREQRGWSQGELGRLAGKPQNVISRLENPDYGRFTIQTLLDIARAFDVALLVKFASFSELAANLRDLSPNALAVPSFEDEMAWEKATQSATALLLLSPSEHANRRDRLRFLVAEGKQAEQEDYATAVLRGAQAAARAESPRQVRMTAQ